LRADSLSGRILFWVCLNGLYFVVKLSGSRPTLLNVQLNIQISQVNAATNARRRG